MKRRAAAPPPRRNCSSSSPPMGSTITGSVGASARAAAARWGHFACGSASPAAARQPAAQMIMVVYVMVWPPQAMAAMPGCPCEYEVEDRDGGHIDAPAMRFGWCWVVFLHTECDAGARRQACQPAEQKMAQKRVRPLVALAPLHGRVRKLQNQGQLPRISLYRAGQIDPNFRGSSELRAARPLRGCPRPRRARPRPFQRRS